MRDGKSPRVDGQIVEIMGRNWLLNELLRAGLEVALPIRDHGIDLIAYADLTTTPIPGTTPFRFTARPIQLKAVNGERFTVDTKYAKFADLVLVHIWHLEDPMRTVAYALTHPESLEIAETMGWTETETWRRHGLYNMSTPSKALIRLLEAHRMTVDRWRELVLGRPRSSL